MKRCDPLSGSWQLACDDLEPQSKFDRAAAFSFPLVNRLDRAVDLNAGGDPFIDEGICDCESLFFGRDRSPASVKGIASGGVGGIRIGHGKRG